MAGGRRRGQPFSAGPPPALLHHRLVLGTRCGAHCLPSQGYKHALSAPTMYRWKVAGNRPMSPAVRAGKNTASGLTLHGSLSLLAADQQLSV